MSAYKVKRLERAESKRSDNSGNLQHGKRAQEYVEKGLCAGRRSEQEEIFQQKNILCLSKGIPSEHFL